MTAFLMQPENVKAIASLMKRGLQEDEIVKITGMRRPLIREIMKLIKDQTTRGANKK